MSTFRAKSEEVKVSNVSRQERIPAYEQAWQAAKKILCIRLDSMGDVLMSSPAMKALKQNRPDRHITLLTSHNGVEIGRLIPEVDQVIEYDAPWMKATAPRRDSHPEYDMAERLRWEAFDGAVIFTTFSQSPLPVAFLTYLAGIPRTLAYCRENPYQLLTHGLPEVDYFHEDAIRHEVRRQLDLVASIGCRTADERLSLQITASAQLAALKILDESSFDFMQPWVLIHPGTSAPSRQYPPEGFAAVARSLVVDHGIQVVFTGTQNEAEMIRLIRLEMDVPALSLAGRLDLETLAGLISLAPVLISNNTGPVHMAAAAGIPIVDLYALTNPQHTPWMVPHHLLYADVPCKYCFKSVCPMGHHDCLSKVSPAAVVEAALELLEMETFSPPTVTNPEIDQSVLQE